jgi:rSAM/selenodomain-associated transferase 2
MLSVIIPVLNDEASLLRLLAELPRVSENLEIIVVDGGSEPPLAPRLPEPVTFLAVSPASRGGQLAAGVEVARGEWIWMLHADNADVGSALQFLLTNQPPGWGRFDVRLTADNAGVPHALRMVAAMMNWRSRITSICTGDQGIFVHRSLLEKIGGVPDQPLMEDVELSRRLKRLTSASCPKVRISASGRRWQHHGVVSTILSMWLFRLRYFFGAQPQALARHYYRG